MRCTRPLYAAALAGVLTLSLAGCAGDPEPEFEPIDVGTAPSEATAPGTSLAIGETAWILDDDTGELVGTTVRVIREMDPATIEGYEDDPELAALTPYAILTQFDAPSGSSYIDLLPVDESGEITGWLGQTIGNAGMGDADACGIVLPDRTTTSSELECFVALADDSPIVGAVYTGTPRGALFADDEHAYASAPITWH